MTAQFYVLTFVSSTDIFIAIFFMGDANPLPLVHAIKNQIQFIEIVR